MEVGKRGRVLSKTQSASRERPSYVRCAGGAEPSQEMETEESKESKQKALPTKFSGTKTETGKGPK